MTTPDDFMEEASEICSGIAEHGQPAQETIATALHAAYLRGREEERKRCAKIARGYWEEGDDIAAAILSDKRGT